MLGNLPILSRETGHGCPISTLLADMSDVLIAVLVARRLANVKHEVEKSLMLLDESKPAILMALIERRV